MTKINIFGYNWQHATDLVNRWIFEWIELNKVGVWGVTDEDMTLPFALIVPISETNKLAEKIIIPEWINMCWVMSTSKDRENISNFHYLFWPDAQDDLKVAVAWNIWDLSQKIIDNTSRKWIKIIETSIDEHDKKMAIIHAMSHTMILLSAMQEGWNKSLIQEWVTPAWTISDMVLLNPEVSSIMKQLSSEQIWSNISDFFIDLVHSELTSQDIKNFSTPTFHRVIEFCKTEKIILVNQSKKVLSQLNDNTFELKRLIANLQN